MSAGGSPGVARAVAIVECLADDGGSLGVSELARRLELPKSSVSRIANELARRLWLERTPGGEYVLGARLLAFSGTAAQLSVMERGRQALVDLQAVTRETAILGVLQRFDVLYVARCEAQSALRAVAPASRTYPANCTAIGKVLLSGMSSAQWEQYIAEAELVAATDRSIVDAEELRLNVQAVGARGYAADEGEWVHGLWCVAAPVKSRQGKIVAAIGLAVPGVRALNRTSEYTEAVCATARSVSDETQTTAGTEAGQRPSS